MIGKEEVKRHYSKVIWELQYWRKDFGHYFSGEWREKVRHIMDHITRWKRMPNLVKRFK